MKTVAIIGGGITGLTAAFRLRQQGVPVTVYESGGRVGGVIETVREGGWLAECGPNTILETSPKIGALVHDLGLDPRRRYSNPAANKHYVVRGGKLIEMPKSPRGFFTTRLFSTGAKLRVCAEPLVRRLPKGAPEESVASFVQRRLGPEFLDYAINPMVAGIYAGNPWRLSVRHAFPKLHEVEQTYGSLILGQIFGARKRRRSGEIPKTQAKKFSFDDGLAVLTESLRARLGESVRLHAEVNELRRREGGWTVVVPGKEGAEQHEHAAVLLAAPAHKLARITLDLPGGGNFAALGRIVHPPVASVVLGFRRCDVAHSLDGFGFLVPELEGFQILGTTFSSSILPDRAPEGCVTLTTFLGGSRNPELALRDADALVEIVMTDLKRLLGVNGRPLFQHHALYPHAIPQYDLGYGAFKNFMTELERKAPGLFFAGSYRDGIALSSSLVSGHDAAARITDHLGEMPAQERVSAFSGAAS
jgi:oxygen-dependent protoporphyrinogen oxidase